LLHGGTTQESTPQGHAPLRTGSVIGERYEVIRQLDQDPLSAVYECRDHEDEQLVWVRLASPALCSDAETALAYAARLNPLVGVSGPRLPGLRAVDVHQGSTLFVVEPAASGTSLGAMLLDRSETRMNADELLPIMVQLAEALDACPADGHHGEVRLERVFVDASGDVQLTGAFLVSTAPPRPLATVLRAHDRLRREFAPEVLTGVARDSADLFGAGQLALQALTGERACEPGATVPARLGGVGDEIAKLIAAHPRRRPPSLTPLLEALARQAGSPLPAREPASLATPATAEADRQAEPTALIRLPRPSSQPPARAPGTSTGMGAGSSGSLALSLADVELMDLPPAGERREDDDDELDEDAKTRQVKLADIENDRVSAAQAAARVASALSDAQAAPGSTAQPDDDDDDDDDDELVRARDEKTMKIAYADIARTAPPRVRRGATTLVTRVPATGTLPDAPAPARPPPRKRRRNVVVPALVAAVVIVAASLAFALFKQWRTERDQHERVREHIEHLEHSEHLQHDALRAPQAGEPAAPQEDGVDAPEDELAGQEGLDALDAQGGLEAPPDDPSAP
jgi:hypothetical protein